MGDWSISTTLSIWLAPRRLRRGPVSGARPPSFRVTARANVSFTSELLPDPLTPVTHTKTPNGNTAVTDLRLLVVTPSMTIDRFFATRRRRVGIGMRQVPARYRPVSECSLQHTSRGVPCATIRPPCSPAPGPTSIS